MDIEKIPSVVEEVEEDELGDSQVKASGRAEGNATDVEEDFNFDDEEA